MTLHMQSESGNPSKATSMLTGSQVALMTTTLCMQCLSALDAWHSSAVGYRSADLWTSIIAAAIVLLRICFSRL